MPWDWDDGTVVDYFGSPPGPFPSAHTYSTYGTYDVTIALYDGDGALLSSATCTVDLSE